MEKYLKHLPECNTQQNWLEADQAFASTPENFRDESYYIAVEESQYIRKKCTCGLDSFKRTIEFNEESAANLYAGKHYLMGVNPEDLSVEDALEAFGFGRNGHG